MKRIITVSCLLTLLLCLSASARTRQLRKLEKVPVSYGLVIDNSGSFRTIMDKVITIVGDVIEANEAEDEAFLLTFVDTPKIRSSSGVHLQKIRASGCGGEYVRRGRADRDP